MSLFPWGLTDWLRTRQVADKTPFQNGYEDAKDGYDNRNNYYWGSSDRQRYNEGYAVGKLAREVLSE